MVYVIVMAMSVFVYRLLILEEQWTVKTCLQTKSIKKQTSIYRAYVQ